MPKVDWPHIIEKAAESPLGILAFALILLSGLALVFFSRAPFTFRMPVFVLLFLGVVGLGWDVLRDDGGDGSEAGSRMEPVDLSTVANARLDWLTNPPVGLVRLGGVEYKILDGPRGVIHTSNLDRPALALSAVIPVGDRRHVRRVHILLNANWTERPHGHLGLARLRYSRGDDQNVSLVVGQTIRETWMYNDQIFGASRIEPPLGVEWREVFADDKQRRCPRTGSNSCEATGFLDALSIKSDPGRALREIEIVNNSRGGGVILSAVTLECGGRCSAGLR